jgi:elongation factor G
MRSLTTCLHRWTVPPINGINPEHRREETRISPTDDKAPFAALAFKIMTDPFVGKLCFFRVYSGTIESGSYAFNSVKKKRERISRILQMHANHREPKSVRFIQVISLQQSVLRKQRPVTRCAPRSIPSFWNLWNFPEPVISVAIEPKSKASQDKMMAALAKLSEEDPTFRTNTDSETGQTLISGMGELHLDIIVDRLFREFKVEANVGAPQVAYKETIRKHVKVDGKFVRQSGGRGQYGHCVLEIEPTEPGTGYEFVNKVVGGVIPKEYIAPIDAGIQEAMGNGVLGGYPVVDVRVTVVDGSYHEVDSSEMAFKIAGSMGFKDGCRKADPVLLEPIMRVDVVVPEDYLGDVMGDINARRGRIEGIDDHSGAKSILAKVPLSQMFGYATVLRSRTQGRGTFVMQISHFEEVPKSIMENILKK